MQVDQVSEGIGSLVRAGCMVGGGNGRRRERPALSIASVVFDVLFLSKGRLSFLIFHLGLFLPCILASLLPLIIASLFPPTVISSLPSYHRRSIERSYTSFITVNRPHTSSIPIDCFHLSFVPVDCSHTSHPSLRHVSHFTKRPPTTRCTSVRLRVCQWPLHIPERSQRTFFN